MRRSIQTLAYLTACFVLSSGGTHLYADFQTGRDESIQKFDNCFSPYRATWENARQTDIYATLIPPTALAGNGDLGLYTDHHPDMLRFILSKSDFYENRKTANSGQADALFGSLAGGSLTLSVNPLPTRNPEKRREVEIQDIFKAEIRSEKTLGGIPLKTRSWISATRNLLIIEIHSLSSTQRGELNVELAVPKNYRKVSASAGQDYIWVTRTSDPFDPRIPECFLSKIAIAARVLNKKTNCSVDNSSGKARLLVDLEPGERLYLTVSVGGGGKTLGPDTRLKPGKKDPVEQAIDLLSSIRSERDLLALRQKHLDWWKNYWTASSISLDTKDPQLALIQRYYYGALYELGCSLRKGNHVPTQRGIWNRDDPMWYTSYILNPNFPAAYFGLASCNRSDLLFPPIDQITDYIPTAEKLAGNSKHLRNAYIWSWSKFAYMLRSGKISRDKGIKGAIIYPNGMWSTSFTDYALYWGDTLATPCSAYLMIEYYRYTLDEEFARKTLYPYLKQILTFLNLWTTQRGGKYHFDATYYAGGFQNDPAIELAGYKSCLETAISISERLGIDPDLQKQWRLIYTGFVGQPEVESNGKMILTLANGIQNPESQMGGDCYPLDILILGGGAGYYSPSDELEKVRNTVDRYKQLQTGYNFPRIYTAGVNARYDASALTALLAKTISQKLRTNMTISDRKEGLAYAGAIRAVNNMLLLSHQGVIKLFGNWLPDRDARFVRLRAPGAFLVSASYDGKKRAVNEGATLFSEAGGPTTVATLWKEGMAVRDSKGKRVKVSVGIAPNHPEEKTYTFQTVKGEYYTFTRK